MSNWNNPNNPNNTQNGWETPSRSSPQGGGTRSCLCKDTLKYSRKCCDGTLWAQGIGNITRTPEPPIPTDTGFLLQQDGSYILQQDLGKIIITTQIIPNQGYLQQQDDSFILQQDLGKIVITQ
jgi:hypothetical protein